MKKIDNLFLIGGVVVIAGLSGLLWPGVRNANMVIPQAEFVFI